MGGRELKLVERRAMELSRDFNHFYIGTEHVFLAVLIDEPYLAEVLGNWSITLKVMTEAILKIAERGDGPPPWKDFVQTPRWQDMKRRAEREARDAGSKVVQSQHIIAAMLREGRGIPARILADMDVNLPQLRGEVLQAGGEVDVIQPPPGKAIKTGAARDIEGMEGMAGLADISEAMPGQRRRSTDVPTGAAPGSAKSAPAADDTRGKKKRTSTLGDYAKNLTALAMEGKLEPVIGRNDEIRRCLQILTRKTKNNPILIGEAGVGKTAVAKGIAQRIADGRVPEMMRDKELWELSMTRLVAGAAYKGEFQDRMQKLMDEVQAHPNIILFIDEIHMLMGAGDHKGGMDAGNILKPALARGEFPVIGATTTDEYQKTIESDPALERRFQTVLVSEPSDKECLEILEGLRPSLEEHHGIKIHDGALMAAIRLSTRFLPDRSLPDKAIDLIDEAAARVKLSASSKSIIMEGPPRFEVYENDIAEVVSAWSGVPVTRVGQQETERLLNIEQSLRTRVIGQEDAIRTVADTIRVMRMGLGNPTRPAGVFLFLGPTGVGKTELAKTLAEFLFGSEKDYIRIDMSEYTEKANILRLIGSPPGYIGHEDEGQLTSQVRRRPFSVVLLDEIEKAHPDVHDIFLQVFDDGRLTDSKGRTVSFTNCIIICTSNIGAHEGVSDPDDPAVVEFVHAALRTKFRLEFINRFDETIIFRTLAQSALEKIVDKLVGETARRARETRGVMLAVGADARAFLLRKGFTPSLGARPLKRAVETFLVKPLAHELLSHDHRAGDLISAFVDGERLGFKKEDLDEGGLEDTAPRRPAPSRPSQPPPPPQAYDEGTVDDDTLPGAGRREPALHGSGERRGTRGSRDGTRGSRDGGRRSASSDEPRGGVERSVMNAPLAPRNIEAPGDAHTTEDDDDLTPTVPRRRPDLPQAKPPRPPQGKPAPRSDAFSDDDFWDDLSS